MGCWQAAAPLWGGVWAIMTKLSRELTGKPLGPANPLLYHLAATKPACFFDVTQGDNKCPFGSAWEGQTCNCSSCEGFEASPVRTAPCPLAVLVYCVAKRLVAASRSSDLPLRKLRAVFCAPACGSGWPAAELSSRAACVCVLLFLLCAGVGSRDWIGYAKR